jgi:acetyl esterase/lipase
MIPQQLVSLLLALTVLPLTTASSAAEEHKTERDISYREQPADDAQRERCLLDIHHPVGSNGFTTLVWFHGGGLTKGERQLPKGLCNQGIAVVGAGYRLASQAKAPASIDDAAAAVAWTVKNIERYGGSPQHIVVCGASAGGYLALMVGLDRRWLAAYGVEADTLAGIIPYSGQCITHFAYRAERGIPETQPVVDELAPLYHVRRDAPPILLITGDRKKELFGRYEENAYMWRMLKVVGHKKVTLREMKDEDHGSMVVPSHPIVLEFVQKLTLEPAATDQPQKAAAK